MWCVVEFEDKSVEAIPSFWFKNKKCAWPKRNVKKCIERRIAPNEVEFDYLKARKLGNDIESYTIARYKVKKAELTSDLSTTEQSESDNLERRTKKMKTDKNVTQHYALWSPASSDDIIEQENTSISKNSPDNFIQYTTPVKVVSSPTKSHVKKKLDFDKGCHSFSEECLKNFKNPESSFSKTIFTQSSSFKEVNVENQLNPSDGSAPQPQLLHTEKILELLNKMNRTLLNMKYDINSLTDKIDNMEKCVTTKYSFDEPTEDIFQKEISTHFPLETVEDLEMFESKLLNLEFRNKMILELKRYARNSLPSTVRAIMRFLFKDKLLEKFSFKGQKKKMVFYTLAICSVIFDAIKLMKKYNKYDTIDVEQPLKVFISGAKFRDIQQTNKKSST